MVYRFKLLWSKIAWEQTTFGRERTVSVITWLGGEWDPSPEILQKLTSCLIEWTKRLHHHWLKDTLTTLLGRLPKVDLIILEGGKMSVRPYVRTSVRPSTKSFFDFNEIWYIGRGRWVMHDGIPYGRIQGQGHEPLKVWIPSIFKTYLLRHLQWELANDH